MPVYHEQNFEDMRALIVILGRKSSVEKRGKIILELRISPEKLGFG
jgi:hypothetical protein